MLWCGAENGKDYLYTVTSRRQQGTGLHGYRVVRSCLTAGEPQAGIWTKTSEFDSYESREAAQQALDTYARTHGWYVATCGNCWHLRNSKQSCDFFFSPVETVAVGWCSVQLRCKKCFAWDAMPPG